MKRLLALLFVMTSVLFLSGCFQKPFEGPEGSVFQEKSTLQFYIEDGTDDPEEYWYFDFDQEYYFFEGPFFNNINFTAINQYQDISQEMTRFLEAAVDVQYYKVKGNYDSTIKLSNKATETSYNYIEIDVDDIYDVDAIMTTENGMQLVFLYSEFMEGDTRIIIPSAIFAFYYQVYDLYNPTSLDTSTTKYDYTAHVAPIMPGSKVDDPFDHPDLSLDFTSIQGNNTTLNTILYEDNCDVLPFVSCVAKTVVPLSGTIDDSFFIEDVYDFYTTNFDGYWVDDVFIFTNNGIQFILNLQETEEEITFQIFLQ